MVLPAGCETLTQMVYMLQGPYFACFHFSRKARYQSVVLFLLWVVIKHHNMLFFILSKFSGPYYAVEPM